MLRFLSLIRNGLIFGSLAVCFFAANLGLIPDGRIIDKAANESPQFRRPAMVIHEALTERPKPPQTTQQKKKPAAAQLVR